MSANELEKEVWQLIDKNCMSMSQEEYLEFLQGIRDDAGMRADTVEQEIEDRNEA